MTTRKLNKDEWQPYCDRVSKGLRMQLAQVDVLGLAVGDQKLVGQWVPLLGIVYDPKDDLLEIALQGLDHMISRPRSISVLEGSQGLESIEIVGEDNLRQIITLRRPASLPTD
tara:strand:- start:6776 stop:7114 length:339 start_codon:yes stop_codon:yes gene_type:complete